MKKSIVKTLSTVFIITAVAKVLGLLRDVVFANVYGTSIEATAYFAALKIPTQIVDIVLSSAITSTFIPVFNEVFQKEGKDKANHFASNFINTVSMIATLLSIIGIIFAPILVKLFASGFEGYTLELTINLVRITFPMIIFTAMAFSFVGFLQSYGEFNVPASISGISNLAVIVFLLLFSSKVGIQGLCYFIVFAWFLQLIIQIPFAKKFGYNFKFFIDLKDQNLKKVVRLAIPILISTAVLPINNLVSMRFASSMNDGEMAALEYAYKLYVVVYGVFTYAVGNIIFPELSREGSKEDDSGFKAIINKAFKLIIFLLIPLTCGIMLYSKDIVSIIYERGNFTRESALATSGALFYYAIGIIGAGLVEIMNKSFYAKQNTKIPLKVGIVAIITNIFLCYILSKTSLGYAGLALATALNAILNGLILLVISNVQNKGIVSRDILINLLKVLFASAIMIFVAWGSNSLLINHLSGGFIKDAIRICIGAGAGAIVYFASTYLLKVKLEE